jgi:hypothetical protein
VQRFEGGVLVAAIDGLGHGDGAAETSAGAGRILEQHAEEPLERLMTRCHEGLRTSRGAVIGLARFLPTGSMHWLAVGDAEGVVVAGAENGDRVRSLPQHRGIVGLNLPPLRPEHVDLSEGDLVATDGVHPDGLRRGLARSTPQWLANDILARSARANDDALVLVVRYTGSA